MLDLLRGVIVNQHFTRRGRTGRLLAALARYPHLLGVGIDKGTALDDEGGEFRVAGSGAVTVIDLGTAIGSNVLGLTHGRHLGICDVRMHVLPEGYWFRVPDRTPGRRPEHIDQRETTMRFPDTRALPGPDVHTHRTVLVALLDLGDLGDLAGRDTCEFPGFADHLLAAVPSIGDHHCGFGYPGGFAEWLRDGTYFGHVVEHVALELQAAGGQEVRHGKTRETRTPGVFRVAVEYRSEAAGRLLLEAARELVEAVLAGRDYPVAERVAEAPRVAARADLGPSTRPPGGRSRSSGSTSGA